MKLGCTIIVQNDTCFYRRWPTPKVPSRRLRKRNSPASMITSKLTSVTRMEIILILLLWGLSTMQVSSSGTHSLRICGLMSTEIQRGQNQLLTRAIPNRGPWLDWIPDHLYRTERGLPTLNDERDIDDPHTECSSRNNLIFIPDCNAGGFHKCRIRDDNRDMDR